MTPGKLDLTIYKGSSYTKPLQWKTGDPLLPVDITGCTINMEIRPSADSTEVIDTLTTTNGRIVIDSAVDGKFTLVFPPSASSAVTHPFAVYDIDIVYPGDDPKYTLVAGKVYYTKEVTKL